MRLRVIDREQRLVDHDVQVLDLVADDVQLDGYPALHAQGNFRAAGNGPQRPARPLDFDEATAKFGGLNLTPPQLRSVNRIVIDRQRHELARGAGGRIFDRRTGANPGRSRIRHEFCYRNAPLDNNTVLFVISQSGETADTLAALREAKRRGHRTLAIGNVVGSTIAQASDGGIYMHAGPEIGVASTKAFTSQCVVLALLALYFGRLRNLELRRRNADHRATCRSCPTRSERALQTDAKCRQIADKYAHCTQFPFPRADYKFPIALEGALKLKEITYIHAEGYSAAEMKHGPIALIDEHTPSVFLVPHGLMYDKMMANLDEIRARGGPIIALASEGDKRVAKLADDVIELPSVEDFLQPIVTIVPLQLLAYHIAVLRGCDVDKPRNLAKSVTVE